MKNVIKRFKKNLRMAYLSLSHFIPVSGGRVEDECDEG